MAQLFEALRYRLEIGGIDSRFCNWNCWLAYTVCPVNNRTAFIRQKFSLHTFRIIAPNSRQGWGRLYRSSKAHLKSCYGNPCSSSVTPLWMSLMSLKCSASRASFTFGWRGGGGLPMPNVVSRGMLDHTVHFRTTNYFTFMAQWAGALICNSSQLLFRNCSFPTWRIRAYRRSIISKQQWLFTVVPPGINSSWITSATSR